jgi:hypothetical protein
MSIEILGRQNPWWIETSAIDEDPHLDEYDHASLKWEPPHLLTMTLDQDVIYILLGPRQVGKTTLFKLLVRSLLFERHIHPRTILYMNCEALGSQVNLVWIYRIYWIVRLTADLYHVYPVILSNIYTWWIIVLPRGIVHYQSEISCHFDQRKFSLSDSFGGITECFSYVLLFEVRERVKYFLDAHPVSYHINHSSNRDSQSAQARHTIHLMGIHRDSFVFHCCLQEILPLISQNKHQLKQIRA